jgi:hypothetical protein
MLRNHLIHITRTHTLEILGTDDHEGAYMHESILLLNFQSK